VLETDFETEIKHLADCVSKLLKSCDKERRIGVIRIVINMNVARQTALRHDDGKMSELVGRRTRGRYGLGVRQ
jgi:hypothetical protein